MKTILAVLFFCIVVPIAVWSQDAKTIEASFSAAGNCGMCKSRIEKALKIEGVTEVRWDKRARRVSVEFLSPPLTLDSLQRRVAAVGHDTEAYTAADSVYASLPDCCLYRKSKKSQ